jgi:O-antigen ligase
MWLWGIARGGADFASSLWQVQRVGYLPIFFFLFAVALRGAKDRAALAKVLILAACIRAALAVYVRETVVPPAGQPALEYATTHPDSMLFAGAVCLVVALLFERFDRKRVLFAAIVLPILVAGMIANTRRIVWVDLAVGMFALYSLTPWTRARRAVTRAVIVASPVVLLYIAVGWSASSETFAPVEIARSVVDSDVNRSTEWRDWENYDLVYTLRQNPLVGAGYGHGYIELVKLPDISQVYKLYRYVPHNSILGLWAYGGIVGFAALWSIYSVAIFFAARVYRRARDSGDRVAALASTGYIVVYLAHCYGDMALGSWTSVFTVAPALAVIGQLAVATGVWSDREKPGEQPAAPRVQRKRVFVVSEERVTGKKEGAAAA